MHLSRLEKERLMGKKVISYSLWGDGLVYTIGAVANADVAKKYWPGWICRYYVSPTVPKNVVNDLASKDNTEVVMMQEDMGFLNSLWRFYAASDPEVDIMLSRDADSRIGPGDNKHDGTGLREKEAVDEWLNSDKDFHIMRDSCQHGQPMAAGMWGLRNGLFRNMVDMIDDFFKNHEECKDFFGVDQKFLEKVLYAQAVPFVYSHDDWFISNFRNEEKHPFPTPRMRGDGWWKEDFPDWHNRWENETPWEDNFFHDENCQPPDCCNVAPCCNKYHDNDYIGQKIQGNGRFERELQKYSHLVPEEAR